METTRWVVVRWSWGGEWLDCSTTAESPDAARREASAIDARLSDWARTHPAVRIAKVRITEVLE